MSELVRGLVCCLTSLLSQSTLEIFNCKLSLSYTRNSCRKRVLITTNIHLSNSWASTTGWFSGRDFKREWIARDRFSMFPGGIHLQDRGDWGLVYLQGGGGRSGNRMHCISGYKVLVVYRYFSFCGFIEFTVVRDLLETSRLVWWAIGFITVSRFLGPLIQLIMATCCPSWETVALLANTVLRPPAYRNPRRPRVLPTGARGDERATAACPPLLLGCLLLVPWSSLL